MALGYRSVESLEEAEGVGELSRNMDTAWQAWDKPGDVLKQVQVEPAKLSFEKSLRKGLIGSAAVKKG